MMKTNHRKQAPTTVQLKRRSPATHAVEAAMLLVHLDHVDKRVDAFFGLDLEQRILCIRVAVAGLTLHRRWQ